jgi:hypothetical protein
MPLQGAAWRVLDCRPSREVSALPVYPYSEVRPRQGERVFAAPGVPARYVRLEDDYLAMPAQETR